MNQIIKTLEEFENIISKHQNVIFFVHSPWSSQSQISRAKLNSAISNTPKIEICEIDNNSADTFIINWLQEQEGKNWVNGKTILARKTSWIHGYGELFKIENAQLRWLVARPYEISEYEILKQIKK